MAIHTFAAIYIGSYEVSLKIFELASRRKLRGVDYVRRRIELGKDAYGKGSIGYELVATLCATLGEFTKIMEEYRVDAYEAYAGAVLRDAGNELFILDQIKLRTGLTVHVLSNSEHRFVSYKSVAMREEFEEMIKTSAAVVDVGGAGLQITLFSKGKILTTQHLGIGAMRMRQQLAKKSVSLAQYEQQIEEMVVKELAVFQSMYLKDTQIQYLIIIGDYMTELVQRGEKKHGEKVEDMKRFLQYLEKLGKKGLEEIADELGLINENDGLIIPYLMICKCMVKRLKADTLWAPGALVSDGIACDYAERNKIYKPIHNFEEDILSAARSLSERYRSYSPHIDALTEMSTLLFDSIKREHGLGKRERLLLRVAAILHDCGKYISFLNAPQCTYDIIMASEIMGLSHLEREIVASIVLYNTYRLPAYGELADRLDEQSYLTVAKLSAILRVSNAMDRSHRQKFKNVKAQLKERELLITIETEEDIALEKTLFAAKTAYFESIFGIKPVIKEKRVSY